MMSGRLNNNLIVIENGQLNTYMLDDKLVWEIGRPSVDNQPDIKLYSSTVSRKHGVFRNIDGIWFYIDNNGKNGTVYNDKHICSGLNGRVKPVMLSDGDIFVFGGGDKAVINYKTVWAMFSTRYYEGRWRVIDTKNKTSFEFISGDKNTRFENPAKGMVVSAEDGIAIYMGDVTYAIGNMVLADR
jgi:pSer/pThr/pTyr-binding forkhead associated (FHA) protein